MNRAIIGFHRDDDGEWVAELACGHGQHVRHRPPFQLRPWVLDAEGRQSRIGSLLACPLCDRAELPDGLQLVRTTPKWDEHTMPAGLRIAHHLSRGTWGRIVVLHGQLRFVARTKPIIDAVVNPGRAQAIPPDIEHDIQPLGSVRFSIDFFSIPRRNSGNATVTGGTSAPNDLAPLHQLSEEGGDPACWAHLLCPECGTVLDAGPHVHDRCDEST
jgi:tellurite resistance-related uncharacterized protein